MTTSSGVGLDPWVEERPGESDDVLQARVQQHGENYLRSVLDKLNASGAETDLKFLDARAPHLALARVSAMMRALKTFADGCFPDGGNDRSVKYHRPIRIGVFDGRPIVASPLMLATTAVIYSQSAWNRRRFHDLRSALRTEVLLEGLVYPPELIHTVPLIVGLKNLVRTSIGGDKEVGVWVDNKLRFDDDQEIAKCFAALLLDCFPASGSQRVDAKAAVDTLVLVTAAYEARLQDANCELLGRFEAFGEKIKEHLRLGESKHGTLVAMEFSKFLFSEKSKRELFLAEVARKYLESGKYSDSEEEAAPFIVWFCLDRYWSTMHAGALSLLPPSFLASRFIPWLGRPKCFKGLLGPGSTQLYRLKLEGDDAFRVILGLQPTIWERVATALSTFRSYGGGNNRIPTAFLARQMEILSYCYPEEMLELHVRGDERIAGLSADTSLWLPMDYPTKDELEKLVKEGKWRDPRLLVTRYAASMVMNRSIGVGHPARIFKLGDAQTPVPVAKRIEAEAKWSELIRWAADKNAHAAWDKYLGKYDAPPPTAPCFVPQRVVWNKVEKPLVLGVDIGGTYTKVALYDYEPKAGTLSHAPRCEYKFGTRKPDKQPYPNADAFVQRLDDELRAAKDDKANLLWPNWAADQQHIVAIGVTWPGAVAGGPGLEYVAANSGLLTCFAAFADKPHWEAEAVAIRGLCLREAFVRHFQRDARSPYVRLLNDAVAHVLFERWQLKGFAPRPGEIVVGLTAGTGSGMAVMEVTEDSKGRILDVLAEVGRLITHISDPFPSLGSGDPSPVGQGRDAFTSETLGKVATELLKQVLPGGTLPGVFSKGVPSLLISWLREKAAGQSEQLVNIEKEWQPVVTGATLDDLGTELDKILSQLTWRSRKKFPFAANSDLFAQEVIRRAGGELADLIATTVSLFGATNVITGGGPLSGCVGKELRASARQALRDDYKYEVPEPDEAFGAKMHRLARLIRLPEPYDLPASSPRPKGPSGPYGAAVYAIELLPA